MAVHTYDHLHTRKKTTIDICALVTSDCYSLKGHCAGTRSNSFISRRSTFTLALTVAAAALHSSYSKMSTSCFLCKCFSKAFLLS